MRTKTLLLILAIGCMFNLLNGGIVDGEDAMYTIWDKLQSIVVVVLMILAVYWKGDESKRG